MKKTSGICTTERVSFIQFPARERGGEMMMTMPETVPGLGLKVRALREKREMSQMALAVATGLSLNAVARLEQGGIPDPRLSTIHSIARALGVSLDQLIQMPTPRPSKPRRGRRPRPGGEG
jgi:DNA-binding XRE family transcriptional regulator